MEAIFKRRSIRKYTDGKVKKDVIDYLLKAAMAAPSANNQQPWEFVVIDDRKLLDQVPDIHPYAQMTREAPAAFLVCADPGRQAIEGYWVQDCAAATENILVEVSALGLGAVWCGVYPREKRIVGFRELFNIPKDIIPFAFIPIGHPAEHKGPSERFDPSRVHYNGW